MIFSRPCRDWIVFVEPTQHCVLGYFQPSLSGLRLETRVLRQAMKPSKIVLSGATHSAGYFRKRAKITTRIRTTRRKALITSRIGSISCSLLCGGETAGGDNLGAAGLGGSMAGA